MSWLLLAVGRIASLSIAVRRSCLISSITWAGSVRLAKARCVV